MIFDSSFSSVLLALTAVVSIIRFGVLSSIHPNFLAKNCDDGLVYCAFFNDAPELAEDLPLVIEILKRLISSDILIPESAILFSFLTFAGLTVLTATLLTSVL